MDGSAGLHSRGRGFLGRLTGPERVPEAWSRGGGGRGPRRTAKGVEGRGQGLKRGRCGHLTAGHGGIHGGGSAVISPRHRGEEHTLSRSSLVKGGEGWCWVWEGGRVGLRLGGAGQGNRGVGGPGSSQALARRRVGGMPDGVGAEFFAPGDSLSLPPQEPQGPRDRAVRRPPT